MNKRQTINVPTPKGVITVDTHPEGDYPGVYVSINGIALVLVEFDTENDEHAVRVWSHEDPHNDYIYKQAIPKDFGSEEDQ